MNTAASVVEPRIADLRVTDQLPMTALNGSGFGRAP